MAKHEAEVNGKKVKIDAPPVIIDDSTFVPLRFIAEAFGAEVRYKEPKTQPVTKNGECMIHLPGNRQGEGSLRKIKSKEISESYQ